MFSFNFYYLILLVYLVKDGPFNFSYIYLKVKYAIYFASMLQPALCLESQIHAFNEIYRV